MNYMKVHASFLPYINGYEGLYYAFICMFLSCDVASPYVVLIWLRLKETRFKTLKIEFMHAHLFTTKPEVVGRWRWHFSCLVGILRRNLVFLTPMFSCHFQRMLSDNVIIFVEFPFLHWHFDLMLNASMMTVCATMRVYMFHGHQFRSPVMSLFFHSHKLYEDITLDDVRPPFIPRSTLWIKSLIQIPTWPGHIQICPHLLRARHHSWGMDKGSSAPELYLVGVGEHVVEDMEMMHPKDLGTALFHSEVEMIWASTCRAWM